MYIITVSKSIPNLEYEDELKIYNEKNYGNKPQREVLEQTLKMEVTDQEYGEIKKSVLATLHLNSVDKPTS